LISKPKQLLNYATKEVSKIGQASFNFLWVFLPQKFSILKEISICKLEGSSRQHQDSTQGGRRLLLTSDFQIEISFKIEFFMEVLPKIDSRKLAQFFRPPSLRNFAASLI